MKPRTPPPPPALTSPLLPDGVEMIVPPPAYDACTLLDKLLVYASSLVVVGSPLWFYGGIIYLYRRWKRYRTLAALSKEGSASTNGDDDDDDGRCATRGETMQQHAKYTRLAAKYGSAIAMLLLIAIWGPHRSRRVGTWLDARRWRLWDAWLRYIGFTVLRDRGGGNDDDAGASFSDSGHPDFDIRTSPAIFAFIPHGIFPFGLAFSCLPQGGYERTWGLFRPVVATATKLFPLVRTFIAWMDGVDASRSAVSSALAERGDGARRLGISPGGIAEMFETFPKPGYHRNDEVALLKDRAGIVKLAIQHKVPIIPVYCFGATKMFRRVQLPQFIETLSRLLKISLCLLYGRLGLPIPFRQRMMYVIGKAIWPVLANGDGGSSLLSGPEFDGQVKEMHEAFCSEVERIFDRNKDYYGWSNKTLRLV